MWIITLFGFLLSGLLDITAFSINSEINANKQVREGFRILMKIYALQECFE